MSLFEVLIFFWKRLGDLEILFFGEEIEIFNTINGFDTRIDNNISLVIDN